MTCTQTTFAPFHHSSISLSFSGRNTESFCSHAPLSQTLLIENFLFHLIQKDYFLGHLKTCTNKINKPQNSFQSLAGCKTSSPRPLLCVQQCGRVLWPEPHWVDGVPGAKAKSWWRRKLAPQNSWESEKPKCRWRLSQRSSMLQGLTAINNTQKKLFYICLVFEHT